MCNNCCLIRKTWRVGIEKTSTRTYFLCLLRDLVFVLGDLPEFSSTVSFHHTCDPRWAVARGVNNQSSHSSNKNRFLGWFSQHSKVQRCYSTATEMNNINKGQRCRWAMKAVLKKCSSSYISYAGSFTVLSFLFSPSLAGARSSVGGKDKDIDACKSTPESRSTCPTATILSGLAPLRTW